MEKIKCASEKLTLRTLGFILLPFVLFFAFVANVVLPVFGFFLAIPLFIFVGVFLAAPKTKTCRLLLD